MRYRSSVTDEFNLWVYPENSPIYPMALKYKSIEDVNNGRNRPDSPCKIVSYVAQPIHNQIRNYVGYTQAVNIPHIAYIDYMEGRTADLVYKCDGAMERKVQQVRKDVKQQFSTLNFMSELREVGSLFKRVDNTWRHWSEVRGIDYQFGVAPMIADLHNACKHYNSVSSRINDLTKRYRNVPVNTSVRYQGNFSGPISFFSGNEHHSDEFFIVKGRVQGEVSMAFPWLAQINPEVFFMMDQLAINPSLANFWEAVPFSWLLDWFLPVGNFLSTLPDIMSPECYFSGTYSFKTLAHSTETTLYAGPGYIFNQGAPAGQHMCRIYRRVAHSYPLAGRVKWDFMGGVNSLAKLSILRDILYPVRKKDEHRYTDGSRRPTRVRRK